MNEKFYQLSPEKQERMINAAYKVFSQSNYKKASMSEIAMEGGIFIILRIKRRCICICGTTQ